MLYFFIFVLGVVLEYHFGLYARTQAIMVYLFTQIYRFSNWIGQIITRFFRWIGALILAFLVWLIGFFPWWLWVVLFLIAAILFALILGMYGLMAAFLLVALLLLILNLGLGLLAAIGAILATLVAWLGGFLADFAKWLMAILAGISLSLPSCSPPTPSVKQVAVVPQVEKELPKSNLVLVQKGDGCIRATARGDNPLNLNQCIDWTLAQGLKVRIVKGSKQAPTLYETDTLEYKDGQWILHRPNHK
jgi:hypothetical protein